MVMTDPLADMFTRIRNASKAGHEAVEIPGSEIKAGIAKILKEKGYIKNFRVTQDDKQGILKIFLRYDETGKPLINQITRVSRPGLRHYVKADAIPKTLGGMGMAILSTSKGILTDVEARAEHVGGELLCKIW